MIHRTTGRLGVVISRAFRAAAPDPFVIAVLLLVVACALGLALGDFGAAADGGAPALRDRAGRVADVFRDGPGSHLWSLLAFAMQMCVVLVSGHALASAGPVRGAIAWVADRPRTGHGAAVLVGVLASVTALLNWGLGLIVGALLARDVGRSLSRRGVPHHYPIIAAAGYFGLMVWHGGLSGSAPLTMTSALGAQRTLPTGVVEQLVAAGYGQGVGLDRTLFTVTNAVVTIGLVVIVAAGLWLLAPRDETDQAPMPVASRPPNAGPATAPAASGPAAGPGEHGGSVPDWLERSPIINWILAGLLIAGLWRFGQSAPLWKLGISEVNSAMLALGLILHGSPRRYVSAVEEAAGACGGIIVQFPIYAAIIGVMVASGLVGLLARVAAGVPPELLPAATFWSASVINLFVPSGGGQWAVQGPIALAAGLDRGVDPGRLIMAVAYGDQLTNMLQPFWALPLLAITGVRARDIVGYTALVMLAGGAWITAVLVVM